MMTESSSKPTTPSVETDVALKQKLEAKRNENIYNNFATPLIGTFLNLPKESVMLKCPACGVIEMTRVEDELKWWADEFNKIYSCLFVTFCCCCCFGFTFPCTKQTDRNHYCRNCGCYFGRSMRVSPIKPKKSAK